MVSPPNSDTSSPPDFMESVLDFNLFNHTNNNTYLSYTMIPDFDLSRVLGDKLANPPSSNNFEDHKELMTTCPLMAPALASIVIRHTFTLHYMAYLAKIFPSNATKPKNEVLDIMHPDDWILAASSNTTKIQYGDDDPNDNHDHNKIVSTHIVEKKMDSTFDNDSTTEKDSTTEEDDLKNLERKILLEHYPYYAFMRLRGFSHDKIIQRCKACLEHQMADQRQRRRKEASTCHNLRVVRGFASVATTLLRNPSKTPLITGVMANSKSCQVNYKNNKTKSSLLMAAPFRSALRIGGKQ
ncbi:uncharacterized protein BX664DRAFT_323177 [Halteromyces radiatus]|uniref:uncharacterized protein n=1 Tax=Halteromyces radiatus TaxID=101107 RepID=UPI00222046F6|nr:uncharacterized protein BX664DRAFT_323177 [Halteromyces radiatus]KAI8100210.1 hypothetical protein BX664DRAFT_323177 [Halteromyces radiatus]